MSAATSNSSKLAGLPLVRIALILVSALLMIGLILLLLLRSNPSLDNNYIASGYVERVADLIETGRLVYQPNGTGDEENTNPWGRIIWEDEPADLTEDTIEQQDNFYDASRRLRRDIEQFNASGDGVFQIARVEDIDTGRLVAQLSFDRYAYNFFLPYPQKPAASVELSSGGGKLPTLGSDRVALGLTPLAEGLTEPNPEDIETLPVRKWFNPSVSNSGYYQAVGYHLLSQESGTVVRLLGDAEGATLGITRPDRYLLYINGFPLHNVTSEETIAFASERTQGLPDNTYRLQLDDRIRIVDRTLPELENEMVFRYGEFDGSSLTRTWIENGRTVTAVDPETAANFPYAAQLVEAIQSFPVESDELKISLDLTVDQPLHTAIKSKLSSYVQRFDSQRSSVPDIEFEPACVAVVDAITGDVVALPTYPSGADLETLERQYQQGNAPRGAGTKLRLLRQNQNLPTIPIGSTTKPILATAIWDTYPDLRRLVVDESAGEMREIYGLRLSRKLSTVGPRTVDPVRFLGSSSNAYTVCLYLLTLADPQSFRVGSDGRVTPDRVDFSRHVRGDFLFNLDSPQLRSHQVLADAFDIDLTADYIWEESDPRDPAFIQPLLDQLGLEPDIEIPRQFRSVTPARTVLNLPEVDIVRGELVSLLLGGGNNRWSNLKLAEAYARIGTGTKVEARLLKGPESEDSAGFEAMPNREVLGLVHQGMTAAWQSGTAVRISDEIRREASRLSSRGLTLKMICKTGTARRAKYECAAFAFYVEIHDQQSRPLAATATTVYLQDRAETIGNSRPRNSAVAVELASQFFPDIVAWMRRQPKVQEALGR
ncbi:MAG: hypothetical protein AAF236_02755 [Verrucomicrobiota bacterium]